MELFGYAVMALVASSLGALGGLGGAVLLVPALVVSGMPASEAAPLGLLTVAAGSIAAGPHQLGERSVNHRLGVATELIASAGAVVGAIASGLVSDQALTWLLASVALAAAAVGARRKGMRNPPDPACERSDVGERVGTLAGAYPLDGGIVPYTPIRLRSGLAFMGVAGFIAGTSGASGGFIKTPATSEVMHVPMKVAAATTTFTVGITSSAALVVFALQGRIDVEVGAAVIVGSLLGGQVGARLQSALPPATIRTVLSVLLVIVAVVLVARG
ncbi:MAG: sulfite exporter TauE/SafE family protein [Acidimicrobiales bacterium]